MADIYGLFWNSNNGDRRYNADSLSEWLRKFFTTGVFNGEMQVTPVSGMGINVATGYANIQGKVRNFDTETSFTVPTANSTYPRIDTVIVQADYTNRNISLVYVQGAYSGNNPEPQAPVRDAALYQIVLAQIYVAAGATEITAANITDTRADSELCGWVTGTVENIDFEQFTEQFESFFAGYRAKILRDYNAYMESMQDYEDSMQLAFTLWFETIRGQLDEDAAGHLQNQIDYLKSQVGIPDAYDPERIYEKGERCIVNNVLYRCTQETISGGFDLNYWRQTTVLKEIDESVSDAKENLYQEIAKGTLGIDSGLFITASGDHMKVTDTEDILSVHQTVKFNFS